MTTDSIDFFIHEGHQPPRLAKARGDETLEAILRREGVALDDDVHLFVSDAAADDEADGEPDEHEPLPPGLTMTAAGVMRHGHVHCHHCKRVQVSVNYQSKTKERLFAPHARIRRIRRWAQKEFELTGPAAGDFVLQPCGSDVDAGLQQHVAEFVRDQTCSVCFDLSKEVTPQG